MQRIKTLEQLATLVDQEVAASGWTDITQERVAQFAQATGDFQWIHLDAERAARESPYGTTIAHGFLTLSLLPALMDDALQMLSVKMTVNYGLNKVRFIAPVPVGSRLRARLKLLDLQLPTPVQRDPGTTDAAARWEVTIERDG